MNVSENRLEALHTERTVPAPVRRHHEERPDTGRLPLLLPPKNGWWILQDADNLTTVIKPDANGNPTLNTELFRSINVLKEIR